MKESVQRPASAKLKEVQRRVELWRERGGGKGSRMPEELWEAAAEVARMEGVYSTARALRVEYSRLKERAASTWSIQDVSTRATASSARSSFVELGMGQLCGPCRTAMEISDGDGARMRVEVTGAAVNIVGVVQTFLAQRS
jgi:hypothetical protein